MNEALKEARLALKEDSIPIGCVIVLNGKIIARAHCTAQHKRDRTAHAEMLALKKAQNILFDLKSRPTVYTTYEPCPMCLGALVIHKVKRVVYGINVDGSGAMYLLKDFPKHYNDKQHKIAYKKGVLAKESYEIFMQSPLVKELIAKKQIKVSKLTIN